MPMAVVLSVLIVIATLGFGLMRFTRLGAVAIAFGAGVPGAVFGILVATRYATISAWTFAVLASIVTATAGATGAFLGRPRHLVTKRKS